MSDHEQKARVSDERVAHYADENNITGQLVKALAMDLRDERARVDEVARESTLRKRAWDLCEGRVAELERERDELAERVRIVGANYSATGEMMRSARALNARLREALKDCTVTLVASDASLCAFGDGPLDPMLVPAIQAAARIGNAALSESASDASEWTREVERRALEGVREFAKERVAYFAAIGKHLTKEGEHGAYEAARHLADIESRLGARAGEGGARE